MSLLTLIQKGGLRRISTATFATSATEEATDAKTVATVADVAVAGRERAEGDLSSVAAPGGLSDAQDSWEWIAERAAIMEIHGGLNRDEANHRAFMLWYRRFVEANHR